MRWTELEVGGIRRSFWFSSRPLLAVVKFKNNVRRSLACHPSILQLSEVNMLAFEVVNGPE